MATPEALQLARLIRTRAAEIRALCRDVDESTASREPEGRWSPKQIISHLCGPEEGAHLSSMRAFLEQDSPLLDIEAANPFYSGNRARMSLAELLEAFDREYESIAVFVEGLSTDQLQRKARIPMLKESALGEYPTLAAWIGGMGGYHVDFHARHLREILQTLGAL